VEDQPVIAADLIHQRRLTAVAVQQPSRVAVDAGERHVGHVRASRSQSASQIRAPHGNVVEFLDAEGTQVSELARRAQMTKQSMAELVAHLERHGYVERIPDPDDRRGKLVRATDRGREVYAIARDVVAELERDWTARLGAAKMRELRRLLEELNDRL
jgi:DNA-binding MarR family transcriptional regulator